jgi:hypothetical protein
MSGCGKSSLLNASVLPRLRKHSPAYITLSVRSFEDPLQALREALTKQGLMRDDAQAENWDMKALLETACRKIKDRRLIVVFDQFEELLIIHGEEGQPTQRAIELLQELKKHPVERLTLLVVFRTEYQGLLIDAGLGPLNSEKNWTVVDPFTTSGAASFLENSGLKLTSEQITTILTEANLYEKTRGFVRAITLNMIGLALDRIAVPRQAVAIHGFDTGGILLDYATESLDNADPNGYGKTVMRHMLSADGTKIPQTIDQLHEKTKLKHGSIESLMLNCKTDGLVRLLDESRRLWEISHDFVANLIAKAVSRDDRTCFQKARPWILAFLLTGWIAFAAMLFSQPRPPSFKEILARIDPNYTKGYYPENHELNLADQRVRDSDIALLKGEDEFKSLATLILDGSVHISPLTDVGLEHLKHMQLKKLVLRGCDEITNAGLGHLKRMPLEQLDLGLCNRITNAGLEHLKDMEKLERLDLNLCRNITKDGLRYLTKMPLKQLSLSDVNITDAGLEILKNMKLEILDLSRCEGITNDGLVYLKDMPLEQLDLSWCNKITDAGIKHLRGTHLRELNLNHCVSITDAGLEYLKDMPLEQLDLGLCNRITDTGLESLKTMPLKNLDLTGCHKITQEGIQSLKAQNPHLEVRGL